jgi:hypothetical protein
MNTEQRATYTMSRIGVILLPCRVLLNGWFLEGVIMEVGLWWAMTAPWSPSNSNTLQAVDCRKCSTGESHGSLGGKSRVARGVKRNERWCRGRRGKWGCGIGRGKPKGKPRRGLEPIQNGTAHMRRYRSWARQPEVSILT